MSKKTKLCRRDAYLRAYFRRVWRWDAERKAAFERARVGKNKYRCEKCSRVFKSTQVAGDHIEPVVDPEKGFVNWQVYYERMFVTRDKLQILCRNRCHKAKTYEENKIRRRKESEEGTEELLPES